MRRETYGLQPEIRYAKAGNLRIAYQILGESNPVDLVWAPPMASHLVLDWEWPPSVEIRSRLARFCRLIRFDKRGTGLSDPVEKVATLEERTEDIRAVMDAVGSEQGVILGISEGGSMACLFAASYPERTRSLILWGVQARWVHADDYPWGMSRAETERMIRELAENGPTEEYLFGGRTADPEFHDFFKRYAQGAASPSAYAQLERMNAEIDVRAILPSIHVPTLVMTRTNDPVAQPDACRALAAAIPNATYVEFPGTSHGIFALDDPVLAEIEEFVTGARPRPSTDRVLSTILFTDIVGSTERAAAVGDKAWRDLLVGHKEAVRGELRRFRGQELDTAGDGFFASFDGPARAIACAKAIIASTEPNGLAVRAGLHTGECEREADKLTGIAVHIGARVAALAQPNEVLVSRTVKDLVAGSGIEFNDRGEHELKGVPGRWRLYSVHALSDKLA